MQLPDHHYQNLYNYHKTDVTIKSVKVSIHAKFTASSPKFVTSSSPKRNALRNSNLDILKENH